MAEFVCTKGENDTKFRILTENGAIHGTNMPYIENCPFCGADKKYIKVTSRDATIEPWNELKDNTE